MIAPLTLRDVNEVYDLRLLLEPAAAAAAAGRIAPAVVARLERGVDAALDVAGPEATERFLEANRAVHVTVAGAAGNSRLAGMVERLLDESERA